jgi:hypothetical protein
VCCFFSLVSLPHLCSRTGTETAAPVLFGIRSAWCRRDFCLPLPTLPLLPSVFPCFCLLFLWFHAPPLLDDRY